MNTTGTVRDAAHDRRQRRSLIGLALLFFAPLILSFYLYYGPSGWRPGNRVNHGDLIDPPRPLPDLTLHVARGAAGAANAGLVLKGKWTLLYVGAGSCSALCRSELYETRQVRIALNRDMDRVQRVFIATGECCDWQFLDAQHPDLATVGATAEAAPLLGLLPSFDGIAPAAAGRIYLIDPLGNLDDVLCARGSAQGLVDGSETLAGSVACGLIRSFACIGSGGSRRSVRRSPRPWWCWARGCVSPMRASAAPIGRVAMATCTRPGIQQAGKAWHEMIHRYAAATLGFIITTLLVWAVAARKDERQPLIPVALLFVIVCAQGALGALTVTMLLKPLIVTSHLLGGLATMSLLWWLSITPERRDPPAAEAGLRGVALAACALMVAQIFLGGWTSTNYAAVACPDFPTCQRAWWPPMDFHDAFVLWRGLNIDYEGGVLDNPARMAIHFTHRIGAVVTGVTLVTLGLLVSSRVQSRRLARAGLWLSAAVLLQIGIGIATVSLGVPLGGATLHNAGAALLVIAMVWLLRALWPAPEEPVRGPT